MPSVQKIGEISQGLLYVSDRDQGMVSGRGPAREGSVFGRSQGRELRGQQPESCCCVLGRNQGANLEGHWLGGAVCLAVTTVWIWRGPGQGVLYTQATVQVC